MRFREEVLAKIFTYITVAVLLGIVAFEAWGLSRERSRRKDAEDNAAVLQEEVENMRDINSTLKKENGFQKQNDRQRQNCKDRRRGIFV